MRAVLVHETGPPQALQLEEVPVPRPGPQELSIDVAFAGTGLVDALFRAGEFGLATPFVPGIEVTGYVREIGPDVEGFEPGQRVAALLNDFGRGARAGGYAEVAIAHGAMTAAVPEAADLPRVTAALINGVTAWLALHDLVRLQSTDRVLVLGASGGLGGTTSRLAALHPAAQIIGVVGHDLSRAPDACTDVILAGELAARLPDVTEDGEVDVIVDGVGGEPRLQALQRLAPFGRLVVLGNASGQDVTVGTDEIWHTTRTITGLSLGATAHLIPERVATALATVVTLVTRDVLREPAPTIAPLHDAVTVHQAFADRTAPAKTVLAIH